ncbi:hypothetical protein ACODM8_11370 [Vibrio ostreicida]|uniref:DUF3265 domain-containing protein n=1 Tax=Vibrio ostreicida TaxID=526588 RepID=A0ABT8BYV3_9VIBR|nr:hypothetical protein [Vibrio ostreicida]MDN3612347.1 hypothetical protein [Vibrio ostreicida]NPD08724.1 hypothetical protein [Vibrio ostreicida]
MSLKSVTTANHQYLGVTLYVSRILCRIRFIVGGGINIDIPNRHEAKD